MQNIDFHINIKEDQIKVIQLINFMSRKHYFAILLGTATLSGLVGKNLWAMEEGQESSITLFSSIYDALLSDKDYLALTKDPKHKEYCLSKLANPQITHESF